VVGAIAPRAESSHRLPGAWPGHHRQNVGFLGHDPLSTRSLGRAGTATLFAIADFDRSAAGHVLPESGSDVAASATRVRTFCAVG
jgi:hypothetical protein